MIEHHPEFHDSYYSLGLLLAEKQNYDESIKYLRKAAELIPNRARILYNLGLLLQFQQKNVEAEKVLLKAIQIEPNSLDYQYALADHYIKSKKIMKAKNIAEEIKLKFPSSELGDQILNYLKNQN